MSLHPLSVDAPAEPYTPVQEADGKWSVPLPSGATLRGFQTKEQAEQMADWSRGSSKPSTDS